MAADPLDAALTYAALGWRVVQVIPNTKRPRQSEWTTRATTDRGRLRLWWSEHGGDGVGIVTGKASGLVVVDVDEHGAIRGSDSLSDLVATYGELPDTVEVVTGGGGRHLFFKYPPDVEIRNDAGRLLGPGLDVRAEGGFVVAPPSLHACGRRYEWEASNPAEVAEMPGWLVELLAKDPAPGAPREPLSPVGHRPGDKWAARTTWQQLLEADGATYLGERVEHSTGCPYQLWARPGVGHVSATVDYKGSGVLKVFSSNWPNLDPEATYTKFGYLAATKFGGSHTAATESLQKDGYRFDDEPDLADLVEPAPAKASDDDPWPDPTPLTENVAPPPFPAGVLPDWIEARALEVAAELSAPVDLPAVLALGAVSAFAAGRIRVRVNDEWSEGTNLYLAVVAGSGVGKSVGYRKMFGPVYAVEADWQRRMRAEIAANRNAIDALEADLKAAKAKRDPDLVRMVQAQLLIAQEQPTSLPLLLLDDATPEATVRELGRNRGRLTIASPEGGLFNSLTRYTEVANLDPYLKGYSGDTIKVHRIGRDPDIVPNPALGVVLTVQPQVIRRIAEDADMVGRGLAARFLICHPIVGDVVDAPPESPARASYEDRLAALGLEILGMDHVVLDLDRAARAAFSVWRREMMERSRNEGDLAHLAEWIAKLIPSTARIAGLLAVADVEGQPAAVTAGVMERSLTLANYWIGQAESMAELWVRPHPTMEMAQGVLDWLRRTRPTSFTLREAQHGLRRRPVPLVLDVMDAVDLLIDHGWVRTAGGVPLVSKRGQKAVEIVVRPDFRSRSKTLVPSRRPENTEGGAQSSLALEPVFRPLSLPFSTDLHDGNSVFERDVPDGDQDPVDKQPAGSGSLFDLDEEDP